MLECLKISAIQQLDQKVQEQNSSYEMGLVNRDELEKIVEFYTMCENQAIEKFNSLMRQVEEYNKEVKELKVCVHFVFLSKSSLFKKEINGFFRLETHDDPAWKI